MKDIDRTSKNLIDLFATLKLPNVVRSLSDVMFFRENEYKCKLIAELCCKEYCDKKNMSASNVEY